MAIAKELTFSNFQHFRSHCEGLKIAMAPPENSPSERGYTPLPKGFVGTVDNTSNTVEHPY